ncbi:Folliculin [Toxocara canis]|uniref:Folliculin n=1 Tax=Toxocara canis TaxID=6265 RepID=A0A0B2VPH2_TOXCA|nr:Folliculin [Toxocara canis]
MELRCFVFVAVVLQVKVCAEGEEKNEVKENELARGFGDDIDWVTWREAKQQSKTLKKPIFLLIHKSWCGACQALKTTFRVSSRRDEFVKLSKEFVMVNTEDDEEPDDKRYSPDGQYIPRIFFLDEDGEPFKNINNKASYPRNSHYFPQLPKLIDAMKRAVKAFSSPTRGKDDETTEEESTKEHKVDDKDDDESDHETDETGGCPHKAKARAMKKEREGKEKASEMAQTKDTKEVDEGTVESGLAYRDGHTDDSLNEVHDDESRCMACSSFYSGSGLVTGDLDAGISYISSQVAVNERVCQLVKHACLRSLSCEVSASVPLQPPKSPLKNTKSISVPSASARSGSFEDSWLEANIDADSDGVILFGDDDHGYTLSHTFRLRDAKARGFQRWFSLIVICMDKLLITNNYEFFVSSLSAIIHQLQEQANSVFFMEQSELANECLKQASRASLLPAHFMRNRVTKLDLDTSRSLALITANPNIFTKLHKQMTYVLRTQARLCTESVLEGVPTQDALVQLELERSSDEEMGCELSATDSGVDSLQQVAALQCVARKLSEFEQQPFALEALLRQLVTGGQVRIPIKTDAFIQLTKSDILLYV